MFKQLLVTSLLALSLSVTARALTLYPSGVLAGDNVSLTDLLADGWSVAHNTGYGSGAITQADITAWGTAAGAGGYVFVGGIDQNGNVILGATGLASEVLTQTFSTTTASLYGSSNLYWYNQDHNSPYDEVGSFGFAPIATVNLSEADIYDYTNPYRLSWHLNYTGGGYRLGDISGLNYDNTYNRIVLVGQLSPGEHVPDNGSTLALLGLAVLSCATLRRRSDA